ncbi:DUF1489 family protein [Sphingobium sp. PAMC28499]|jgi:hypothetical protein|uniref:DUF1489 family protein n=1 Tax=Sphingobium sp. PAMC28499 TaxID=2565554 RepID=UPI00109D9F56|nr:DUF1489 domain-containing protein [Sphingobium sp. PAMC28499]QCB40446.1 DUF1489 family protein [Sphingobium sp. PAMC28499]
MPLHLTKIAFQSESPVTLKAWLESHADEARLTTRYLPKRLEEMEGGSLYWIHGHALVGRSPILGFQETGQGRYWIRLAPRLIPVRTAPKRAHQGWRYLEDKDAPPDLGGGEADDLEAMPPAMLNELARLGLV